MCRSRYYPALMNAAYLLRETIYIILHICPCNGSIWHIYSSEQVRLERGKGTVPGGHEHDPQAAGASGEPLDGSRCGKRHCVGHFYTKTTLLPRQARDKHGDSLQKGGAFFAGAPGSELNIMSLRGGQFEGQGMYSLSKYLRERGDTNVRTVEDLISKAKFFKVSA